MSIPEMNSRFLMINSPKCQTARQIRRVSQMGKVSKLIKEVQQDQQLVNKATRDERRASLKK